MEKITKSKSGTEWSFVVDEYRGAITAEEFASRHNVTAVNDNSGKSYQFVGSLANVERALDEYSKN